MGRPRLYATRAEKDAAYYQRQQYRRMLRPLPPGPYRVLYADPPWTYFQRDPNFHGYAANHYPTMSIAELCALPVRKIAAPQAVLFLWITPALLCEGLPVMRAWGFLYKTCLVWDKIRMIHGKDLGNQHELLLVGTRGACKPDTEELEATVRRLPPPTHSTKPTEFRLLIEHLYKTGPYLELFARARADGWDSWGNALADLSPVEEPAADVPEAVPARFELTRRPRHS
jgi:N6-adenosine-specific RNA methylase IME4